MAGRKTPKDSDTKKKEPPSEVEAAPVVEETAGEIAPEAPEPEVEGPEAPGDAVSEATAEPEPVVEEIEPAPAEAEEIPGEPAELEPSVEPEPSVEVVAEQAPRSESPAPTVVKRGPGFIPLVLGGVVAAGIGYGAAHYLPQSWWPFPKDKDQTAALKAELDAQAKTIAGLTAQLAAATKTADGLTSQIDAVSNDMGGRIAELKKTVSAGIETNTMAIADLKGAMAKAPAGGGAALSGEASAEIATLNQKVAALETDVQSRIDAAKKAAEAARVKAEAEAKLATARAAVTRIEAAMTAGGPFGEAVTSLQGAGIEVPPALAGVAAAGVPSKAALAAAFDPAARQALDVSIKQSMGGGVWARISAFLQVQTGARSLTPRQGTSPDAVLSRARADVEKGDFSAAIETIKALPPEGQKAMAGWVAEAETRLKAEAAAKAVAAKLNGE